MTQQEWLAAQLLTSAVGPLVCVCSMQAAAKDAEISRLANDVDSLGLQLGRARGELAKQVCQRFPFVLLPLWRPDNSPAPADRCLLQCSCQEALLF